MATSLSKILELTGGRLAAVDPDDRARMLRVCHITLNSRETHQRGMFAAVPGSKTHGASFAKKCSAAAILTDEEGARVLADVKEKRPIVIVDDVRRVLGDVAAEIYGHPSQKMKVIGITGTSGKTTVSHMLEAGLMACGYTVGIIGTNGTRIDGVTIPTELTTPEAPKLQELFAHMLSEGVTHVVMEVSSHALCLGRVTGTHFVAAGFTNLSQDHLDFHATMDEYFKAKALLFKPGGPVAVDHKVVCVNDKWGRKMAVWSGPSAVTVSTIGEPALITTTQVDVDDKGMQHFQVHTRHGDVPVDLLLPGAFNVANAALSLGVAEAAGADPQRVADGLAGVQVPGRMQRIDVGQDFTAVVDYAHKPAALAAVLQELSQHAKGRIAVVVGCGGDRDPGKRAVMGAEAATRADLAVITDDNPRSEDPALIRAAMIEGAQTATMKTKAASKAAAKQGKSLKSSKKAKVTKNKRRAEIVEIGDRRDAIFAAVKWAQPGDVVVVAGKGHETGQKIGDEVLPFDDRLVLEEALRDKLAAAPDATVGGANSNT